MTVEATYLVTQLGSVCPVADSEGQKYSSWGTHGNRLGAESDARTEFCD